MNIGWALHIARTMECHFDYKLEIKRPLVRCKLRLEDEFKINVKNRVEGKLIHLLLNSSLAGFCKHRNYFLT